MHLLELARTLHAEREAEITRRRHWLPALRHPIAERETATRLEDEPEPPRAPGRPIVRRQPAATDASA